MIGEMCEYCGREIRRVVAAETYEFKGTMRRATVLLEPVKFGTWVIDRRDGMGYPATERTHEDYRYRRHRCGVARAVASELDRRRMAVRVA